MLWEDYDKLLALPSSAFPYGIPLHATKNTPGYGNWRAIPKVEDRKTHLPLYLGFKNGLSWEGAE